MKRLLIEVPDEYHTFFSLWCKKYYGSMKAYMNQHIEELREEYIRKTPYRTRIEEELEEHIKDD